MPQRAPSGFDSYTERYRDAVQESIAFSGADHDLFTRIKADVLLDLASEWVGPSDGLEFLDVGCGPGETDSHLEGRVRSLAGIDVAAGMVDRARRRNPWAEYREYAADDPIPYDAASFDVCFVICVLHHVPPEDRLALVGEMTRVCRPGGLVVVFEHNPLNPLTRKAVRDCEFDRGVKLLTRGAAARLLEEGGLRPRGRYIEFFPRDSGLLRGIEGRLGWLPLGAQYAVFAQRP
jgi:SAM-dependent methyltransferase